LVRAFDTTGGTLGSGMMGTFLYTAPEVMGNPQDAEVAADVYSLAMTAAFCLSGAELPVEVLRNTERVLNNLKCRAGVRAALQKALAWEPGERFGSMAEFIWALEESKIEPLEDAPAAEVVGRKKEKSFKQQRWVGNSLSQQLEQEIPKLPEADRPAAVV